MHPGEEKHDVTEDHFQKCKLLFPYKQLLVLMPDQEQIKPMSSHRCFM